MTQPAYLADEPDDTACRLLVGISAGMQRVRAAVRTVAPSRASVLVCGPTGSGKEVVAKAIHAMSDQARGPFVAVNCGAIPGELIESELFGHERGAFTGAHQQRIGHFEAAAGGTLLLDEVGDMPLHAQVRLLRALEDRSFTRVGGTRAMPFTGRIIAASHCNLPAAMAEGRFRSDLWYRLAVTMIDLPPLCERLDDIPSLVSALSRSIEQPALLSDAALTALAAHDWPGNVRELRSVLVRAALVHPPGGGLVDACHIEPLIDPGLRPSRKRPGDGDDGLSRLLAAVERRQLSSALQRAGGVVAVAARMTGVNRTTFVEKMRRHGLSRCEAAGHCPARPDRDVEGENIHAPNR